MVWSEVVCRAEPAPTVFPVLACVVPGMGRVRSGPLSLVHFYRIVQGLGSMNTSSAVGSRYSRLLSSPGLGRVAVLALSMALAVSTSACKKLDPTEVLTGSAAAPKVTSEVNLGKVSYSGTLSDEEKNMPVATVDGQPVTQGELFDAAGGQLFRLRTDAANKEYMTKRKALDDLISDRLLKKEAESRGMTPEALVKAEVTDKLTPPSDQELQEFFNQVRRRFPPEATFEEHRDELLKVASGRKADMARDEFLKGLQAKARVEVTLPYPELPVVQVSADDDPRLGPDQSPVTIIEWSDFQCPYCKRNGETLKQVKDKYGDKVSIVFRDFPLPFHDKAPKAAQAGECAHEQGKFWEMHDKLFGNQGALDVDGLKTAAAELGLDTAKFAACIDGDKYKAEIDKDTAEGKVAGVTGTPASFINGKMVSGALPIETYSAIIDSELKKLGM